MERLRDEHIHPYIEKKLIIRLYVLLVISIALAIYIIKEIVVGDMSLLLGISGVCIGMVAGIIRGRLSGVVWHEKKEKVIAKLDTAGVLILVVFVIIDIKREWIFGHWIRGVELSLFTVSVLSGLLAGRFFGMKSNVMKILKDQDIAEGNPEDVL